MFSYCKVLLLFTRNENVKKYIRPIPSELVFGPKLKPFDVNVLSLSGLETLFQLIGNYWRLFYNDCGFDNIRKPPSIIIYSIIYTQS